MKKVELKSNSKEIDKVIKLIKNSYYFKSVPTDLLREILESGLIFQLKAGDYLIKQDDISDRMVYIFLYGEFKVFSGNQFILKIVMFLVINALESLLHVNCVHLDINFITMLVTVNVQLALMKAKII